MNLLIFYIHQEQLEFQASKNFESVTTICGKKHFKSFVAELEKNNGKTTLEFRKKMAKQNFKLTSDYDLSIFKWFDQKKSKKN